MQFWTLHISSSKRIDESLTLLLGIHSRLLSPTHAALSSWFHPRVFEFWTNRSVVDLSIWCSRSHCAWYSLWISIAGTSDQVSFCSCYCRGISQVDMLFLLYTLSPVLAIYWNEAKALKRNNQRCVSCPTMKCYVGCAPIFVLSVDTPLPPRCTFHM